MHYNIQGLSVVYAEFRVKPTQPLFDQLESAPPAHDRMVDDENNHGAYDGDE